MEYLQRGLTPIIKQRLNVDPLVIIEGARATGKTSLLKNGVNDGWLTEVRSLTDQAELAAATSGPQSYIDSLSNGTAIDEAQLAEEITLAIKQRIDSNSRPGQIILTGSTRLRRNALGGSDPLAGRVAAPLTLRPMTMGERAGTPINLLPGMLHGDPLEIPLGPSFSRADLTIATTETGMPGLIDIDPTARHSRATAYLSSVTALQAFESRNIRNVASLARYLAGRTSSLVNVSDFSQAVEISRDTVENYLANLEEALLIHRLPGWRKAKDKSETERAKLHFFDTGIASSLAALRPAESPQDIGRLVETLVAGEMLSQASWTDEPLTFYHWRRKNLDEVDLLIESLDGLVVCIEVKSSESVDTSDFKGINAFRKLHPDRFRRGFVFYAGSSILPFGDNCWALPFSSLRPEVAEESDPIESILHSIAEERASASASLDHVDRRIEEYVREIRSAASRLGESSGYDYEVVQEDPAPQWSCKLLVEAPMGKAILLSFILDLRTQKLTIEVPAPGTNHVKNNINRNTLNLEQRPASETVHDALSEAASSIAALLKRWDRIARTGPKP